MHRPEPELALLLPVSQAGFAQASVSIQASTCSSGFGRTDRLSNHFFILPSHGQAAGQSGTAVSSRVSEGV